MTIQNIFLSHATDKPFDIVTDIDGNVGFIQEVNINDCQDEPEHQVKYAVNWLTGDNYKCAWFKNDELTVHANMLIKIAESACHPLGRSADWVRVLFSNIGLNKKAPTSEA